MIELVALDMAGTTVQEYGAVYVALREAVEAAGGAPGKDDIDRWMGADKREAIAHLLAGKPSPETVEVVHTDFQGRLSAAYAARRPEPLPGVPEAFAAFREAGIKIALTTGFDRPITGALLDALGWDAKEIDAVVCADDVREGRPAPYMIFRAMEATGVHRASSVLVAGDTTRDLRAGANAGAAYVVGVLTGGMTAQQLGVERHTHILPGVADIPALLGLAAAS